MRYEDIDWTQVEKRINEALPLGKPTAEPKDWSNLDIDSHIKKAKEAIETPEEKPVVIPEEPKAKTWEDVDIDAHIQKALSETQTETLGPPTPTEMNIYGFEQPTTIPTEEPGLRPEGFIDRMKEEFLMAPPLGLLTDPLAEAGGWYRKNIMPKIQESARRWTRQLTGTLPTTSNIAQMVEYIKASQGEETVEVPEGFFSKIGTFGQPLKYKTPGEAKRLLNNLALEGKIPPPELIKAEFGEEAGDKIIRDIESLSPRLFKKEASRSWNTIKADVLPYIWATKHPYIAAAISPIETPNTIVSYLGEAILQQLTDPYQWVFDFGVGVGGKAILVPAVKMLKRSRLAEIPMNVILKSRIGDVSRLKKIDNPEILRELVKQYFEKSNINPRAIRQLENMPSSELHDLFTKIKSGQPVTVYLPIDDLPIVKGGAEQTMAVGKGLKLPAGWKPVAPEVDFETDKIARQIMDDFAPQPPYIEEPAYIPQAPEVAQMPPARPPMPAATTPQFKPSGEIIMQRPKARPAGGVAAIVADLDKSVVPFDIDRRQIYAQADVDKIMQKHGEETQAIIKDMARDLYQRGKEEYKRAGDLYRGIMTKTRPGFDPSVKKDFPDMPSYLIRNGGKKLDEFAQEQGFLGGDREAYARVLQMDQYRKALKDRKVADYIPDAERQVLSTRELPELPEVTPIDTTQRFANIDREGVVAVGDIAKPGRRPAYETITQKEVVGQRVPEPKIPAIGDRVKTNIGLEGTVNAVDEAGYNITLDNGMRAMVPKESIQLAQQVITPEQLAKQTGYDVEDINFMRSQGLTDDAIINRSATEMARPTPASKPAMPSTQPTQQAPPVTVVPDVFPVIPGRQPVSEMPTPQIKPLRVTQMQIERLPKLPERKTTQQWLKSLAEMSGREYDDKIYKEVTERLPYESEMDQVWRDWIADNKIPPQEISKAPDGSPLPVGGATDNSPQTDTVEKIVSELYEKQKAIEKEQSQAGFIRVRGGKKFKEADIAKKTIDPELNESMDLYRKGSTKLSNFVFYATHIKDGLDELWRVRDNRWLEKAALGKNRYVEDIRFMLNQSRDLLRTNIRPIKEKAEELTSGYADAIWGKLDNEERHALEKLIYLNSFAERGKHGLPTPTGKPLATVLQNFVDYYTESPQSVKDAFHIYDRFQKTFVLQNLIKRGKLDPKNVFDFYAHHEVLDYMFGTPEKPIPWTLTRPLKPRFRGYLMEAKGSEKPVAVGLDIIQDNWTKVIADNMLDDNAIAILKNADTVTRATLAQKGFNVAAVNRVRSYPFEGEAYIAMQYEPGNAYFRALGLDEDLAEDAIYDALLTATGRKNDILNMNKKDQTEALLDYFINVGERGGNAIRDILAVGKKKPIYLVPQELAFAIRNVKSEKYYVPLMREVQKMTNVWKGLALNGIFIPYNVRNFVNYDLLNFSGFLGAWEHAPSVTNSIGRGLVVLKHFKELLNNPNALGPEYADLMTRLIDKDVIGSGYLSEYIYTDAGILKKAWNKLPEFSNKRELWLRIAMADFQLNRLKRGLPLIEGPLAKRMTGLTTDQKVGFIARNFTGDYGDTPAWFDNLFRRFGMPFGLGAVRGRQAVSGLVKEGTIGMRPDKFLLPFGAAVAGAYAFNHWGDREKVMHKLGPWNDKFTTMILATDDDDGDGEPDRAWVMRPRWGVDEAAEWIGMDHFIRTLHKMAWIKEENGIVTKKDVEKLIAQQLTDMGWSLIEEPANLLAPWIQAAIGVFSNKDPYDKQRVYPEGMKYSDMEAWRYTVPYVVGKLLTPLERYATQRNIEQPWLGVKEGFKDPMTGFRTLYNAMAKGPFNILGAAGIYEIDLNDAADIEAQIAKQKIGVRMDSYKRKIENEFVMNTPADLNTAYSQFTQQVQNDLNNLHTGQDLSPVGEIIRDALSEGIDLGNYILGSYEQSGSLLNRIYSPRVLDQKIEYLLKNKQGRIYRDLFGQGGQVDHALSKYDRDILTNEQITQLQKYDRILTPYKREGLKPDKGTEVETLRKILPLLGIDSREYFQQLGINPEQFR